MSFDPLSERGIPVGGAVPQLDGAQRRALYRSGEGRTNNPVLQKQYREFGSETERHVEVRRLMRLRVSAVLCIGAFALLAGCGDGDGRAPANPKPSTSRSAGSTAVPGTAPSNAPPPRS